MQQRTQPFHAEVTRDGVIVTVTLTGKLDITSAPGLAERLAKVMEAHPERLVLDLGGLVFVDVAGGRTLDRAHEAALKAGCPVIVRWPRPCVRRVIQLAGFLESQLAGLGGTIGEIPRALNKRHGPGDEAAGLFQPEPAHLHRLRRRGEEGIASVP